MKKISIGIISIFCFMVVLASTAFAATGKRAYGSVSHGATNHPNPIQDKAWVTITENGDRPVSNNLAVVLRVQYQSGNNFEYRTLGS